MSPRRSTKTLTGVVGGPLDDEEIEISPGLFIKGRRWEITAEHEGRTVTMVVRRTPHGHVCEELRVGGNEGVTGQLLRGMPLASWIGLAAALPYAYRKSSSGSEPVSAQELVDRGVDRSKGAKLATVVEAYRSALADPMKAGRATQEVADQLGYGRGYISGLLSEARRLGMLAPARRGRAGEFEKSADE